ncbi:probable E3 ubiquitin-protein ligase makorin-1 isoform X2 [Cylas formicarius]|nr:probable E3 ubiquitin-protein ligase makorin-1 isoform X2 [Cylas formicarius]XP_060515762.1 probable E3 ubiquitin-protein ligase makorin-1 isoform X2 [Cylas formicarius]
MGNCPQQNFCQFRHDRPNNILKSTIQRTNPKKRTVFTPLSFTSTNMPSTSTQPSFSVARQSSSAELSGGFTGRPTTVVSSTGMRGETPTVSSANHPSASRSWADAPEFIPSWEWTPSRPQAQSAPSQEGAPTPPSNVPYPEMSQFTSSLGQPNLFNIGIPLNPLSQQNLSYSQAANSGRDEGAGDFARPESNIMCPYTTRTGICMNLTLCPYRHPELCDMCGLHTLNPFDEEERRRHQQECLKQHEKNMELSFAIARSKEKSCGVCFEVIMEKANGEQRFGILPNCNHCFCLSCIRKWRQVRQFENKIIRACPECRVTSDFVCPSMYWVDTKEDKDKLIDEYKKALSRKDCKYFKKGEGKCPFGNKCFYLHAAPDGKKVDVGPPPRQRRHRHVDADMEVLQVMLWDFLDERDFPWQSLADELEDLASFFSDSDESVHWSDGEYNYSLDFE